MNYKVMKRPMFRLGGSARPGYSTGTGIKEIEKLISERAAARDKLIGGMRTMMPLQVLAGQPGLQTIRKPTDVLSLLSDIGKDPNLFNALMRSQSLDLKMKEGELTDKITLAKLKKDTQGKTYEFQMRMKMVDDNNLEIDKILAKDPELKDPNNLSRYRRLEDKNASLLRKMSEDEFVLKGLLEDKYTDATSLRDRYRSALNRLGSASKPGEAEGGRVGYQEGTPEPMMQQPMMEETVDVQETMQPEAPKENTMSVKQMYDLMRQRIPVANVSDKDLYKIASSEQIMADFASLETMSDVTQFNEQYDTNIVLDLPIVG